MKLRLLLCGAIYAGLVIWLVAWPYTGDGDSALHYLSLRAASWDRAQCLTAWARPAYVALMAIPAMGGIVAVRCCAALVSLLLVWQTMRMADDLRLPNPTLAGLFVIWQPLVFALASDTMTEIPMALGVVLGIRLWWARHPMASSILVSFLPLVRPEGFFLILIWAVLVMTSVSVGPMRRRLALCALLATGMVAWMFMSLVLVHDPVFFITSWPWAAANGPRFQPLPLLHYVTNWPYYCGPVLIVLFVIGVIPSLRREMWLPWAWWMLVMGVHSILSWQGRFQAFGLLRVQAATAATTALVCLHGWNTVADALRRFAWGRRVKQPVALLTAVAATFTALSYYWTSAEHYRGFALRRAAEFIRAHRLIEQAPRFFVGDYLLLAELGMGWDSWPQLVPNSVDHAVQLERLGGLPVGSVGVWDNQQAQQWFGVTTAELLSRDYEVLDDVTQVVPAQPKPLPWQRPNLITQRFVVLRKRAAAAQPPLTDQ